MINLFSHESIFNFILTPKAKRMIFISSITPFINDNIEVIDEKIVRKLNAIFEIADDERALLFPRSLSKIMWSQLDTNKLKDIDYLLTMIPSWLRYGSNELMMKDISFIKFLNTN